ncbi:MAG: Nucleotidyl transferase [Frankiales bacterium]|nr:Nucleotidyl transferase [Frankiales bacterium]
MRSRSLALVLAGGAGGRLELLTEHRAKPAVPYAGTHRLVDVPLSACGAAGVDDVWVLQQNQPVSVSDHLANGRPWDLDRTDGGLLVLHPSQGTERGGFTEGTADGLWRQAPLLREADPDVLVLMSADAGYRIDLDAVITAHQASGAAITAVTAPVPEGEEASRFGVVEVDGERVTSYAYKPEEPASQTVTTEIFVCDPDEVLGLLEELAHEAGDEGLEDLGTALLPRLADAGRMRAHALDSYWRDVGTVDSYWRGHQELLGPEPAFRLHDERLPVRTRPLRVDAARLLQGAEVEDSLLGPGCTVAGTVVRSVLGAGAVVERGAVVRDCVLLPGAVVRAGAVVERTVLDDAAEVAREVTVGGRDAVTLVGTGAQVSAPLSAGARYPEPERE